MCLRSNGRGSGDACTGVRGVRDLTGAGSRSTSKRSIERAWNVSRSSYSYIHCRLLSSCCRMCQPLPAAPAAPPTPSPSHAFSTTAPLLLSCSFSSYTCSSYSSYSPSLLSSCSPRPTKRATGTTFHVYFFSALLKLRVCGWAEEVPPLCVCVCAMLKCAMSLNEFQCCIEYSGVA